MCIYAVLCNAIQVDDVLYDEVHRYVLEQGIAGETDYFINE